MSIIGGRMTLGRDPPSRFVVADSTFELEIKNGKEFLDGQSFVSDKIQLMKPSNATWTIGSNNSSGITYFFAFFQEFPNELKSKSIADLSVLCGGTNVSKYYSGSLSSLQIIHCGTNIGQHFKNNSLTLSFRLVITCEGDSALRRKFYDSYAATKSFINSISNMLGDPTFSDFTFVVGGRTFKVHMSILAAASPVMRKMFTADLEEAKTKECTIDAISPVIFDHLLRFVYRQEIPEDLSAVAKPLYEAAHYYEIEILKKICLQEIHESLTPANALEVYEWVQPYDSDELKNDAWAIVKRDVLKIFGKLKSEPLPLSTIKSIIKQREQENTFWKELDEEILEKTEKTS